MTPAFHGTDSSHLHLVTGRTLRKVPIAAATLGQPTCTRQLHQETASAEDIFHFDSPAASVRLLS